MNNDRSQVSALVPEWEYQLGRMIEIGRVSKYEAYSSSLILLALAYIKRRDQLPKMQGNDDEPLKIISNLATKVELYNNIEGQPISQILLSGMVNTEPKILSEWLYVASENWSLSGFDDWFADKLDGLGLAHHHDTPSSLSQLVASLFVNCSPLTILDPACGTGSLLASIAKEAIEANIFGQEMSLEACAWARLRFLVLGLHVELATGNALIDPAFARLIPERKFDLILTNPPFGMHLDSRITSRRSSNTSSLMPELFGRITSEAAYVRETVDSLSDSGVAAVIVPMGFLTRGGADQKLRETLVLNDVVQAIVGLPERLFAPSTSIQSAILFLNRQKIAHQKKRILFLDARQLGRREGIKAILDGNSALRITTAFANWHDEPGFARVITSSELDHVGYSLSPARYVGLAEVPTTISFTERRSQIIEMETHYAELSNEYELIRSRLILNKKF